jgi:hypothetical protein
LPKTRENQDLNQETGQEDPAPTEIQVSKATEFAAADQRDDDRSDENE